MAEKQTQIGFWVKYWSRRYVCLIGSGCGVHEAEIETLSNSC